MSIFFNNLASENFLENGQIAIIQLTRHFSVLSCHLTQRGQHVRRKCTRWYKILESTSNLSLTVNDVNHIFIFFHGPACFKVACVI